MGCMGLRKPTKDNLGELLVQSFAELRNGPRGQSGKLTTKTMETSDPPLFCARERE